LLATQALGVHVNLFFQKTEQYNVDPMAAAAVIYCESRGNPKARNVNRNGTIDRGIMQINTVHNAAAARRGNDLDTVEGNLDFGLYLISKQGFAPYSASSECIGKTINRLGDSI
jgi:soluble lytic murein transglycosylase-like protein